jgi:hypothetical protein
MADLEPVPSPRIPIACESAALVVAHPGHELRVHRWLEIARPVTFVLTRGDGRHGASRLDATSRVLQSTGARAGAVFGDLSDGEIYEALLAGDQDLFAGVLDRLSAALIDLEITHVAADAEEGHNPSHDICRYLAATAAAIASRAVGRTVADLDFAVVGRPDECPEHLRNRATWIDLDDEALARKLESARRYAGLGDEVARALAANGREAFRVECLRAGMLSVQPPSARPFYEEYGERQVAAGHYARVVRFAEHVLPVKKALLRRARIGA